MSTLATGAHKQNSQVSSHIIEELDKSLDKCESFSKETSKKALTDVLPSILLGYVGTEISKCSKYKEIADTAAAHCAKKTTEYAKVSLHTTADTISKSKQSLCNRASS